MLRKNIDYHMYSITGKLIDRKVLEIDKSVTEIGMKVDNLEPGIYFIKVSGASFNSTQKIFLK